MKDGREMESTAREKAMMRAEDGGWPRKTSANSNRQRVQARGLGCDRNRGRVHPVPRSTTHTGDLAADAGKSRLVEATGNGRPGCRTETGHARRVNAGRLAGRGFKSPRVHNMNGGIQAL